MTMKRPFKVSQYNRHIHKAALPAEQDPVTQHDIPAPEAREKELPAGHVQQKREEYEPDQLAEQNVVTEQETLLLRVALKPPSADISPCSDPLIERTLIAEQETASLQVLRASPSLDDAPHSDPLIEQALIAEQETASLNLLSKPQPAAEQEAVALPTLHMAASRAVQSEQPAHSSSVVDQETMTLAAPVQEVHNLSGFFRHLFSVGLARLQEPRPEGALTRGLQVIRPGAGLGLVSLLALINASGLFIVSLSYYLSVEEYSYPLVEVCFLGGLLLLFAPNMARLLSRRPLRLERICLLCVLGLTLSLVDFTRNPITFSSFDGYLHWRTVEDIIRTSHLFSVNSMLPVSPYYPGLEMITDAISSITGLNVFYSGLLVTMTAHFLMVLVLFLFLEQITGSSRMAGIGVLIYITNQHFTFFDSDYSYETLALPLALLVIYILARYTNAGSNWRRINITVWFVLIAVNISHHMTSYVFDGLLLLWTGVSFFRPVPRKTRIYFTSLTLFALLFSLAYAFLLPGNPVWTYLSEYFGSAFGQLEQIITGIGAARPLFASNVQAPPIWDKLFITGAIALVTFSLPFGLITLQRLHREDALAITLGLASLLYPLTEVFRFTSFGTEITDRAAAFLFLPIAYILAMLITHFWPTRQLSRKIILSITGAILVIFLGNLIVATGPNLTGIPGPYLVVADGRSVESEGIEAAMWSLASLGPDNRVATDRINQMLMSTYGHQRVITRLNDNIDIAPLFYSSQFTIDDIALLQQGQIRYLAVDTRLSKALPLEGTYFENDVPQSIISRDALTKFNTVTLINRLFDSGDIVIYDVGAFLNGAGP